MASISELDPALKAGIQKWVEVDKVTPEVQTSVEGLLKGSSLARLIFEICGGLRKGDRVSLVQADEEFSALWESKSLTSKLQRSYAEKGKAEHAKYLAFGAPFSKEGNLGAAVASSPIFKTYIEYTRDITEVGPTFLKVLDVFPYTDKEGLKFFAQNIEVFAALDQEYYQALDAEHHATLSKDKENVEAKKVREFAEDLIRDALFLPGSNKKWREFVRNNFSKIFVYASNTWFPMAIKIDPTRMYESLENKENTQQFLDFYLVMKLIFSSTQGHTIFTDLLVRINSEPVNESLKIVKDILKFAVDSGENIVHSRHVTWLEQFLEGKISIDKLNSFVDREKKLQEKRDKLVRGKDRDQYTAVKPYAMAIDAFIDSDLFYDFDPSFIQEHDIFPTDLVVAFLKKKGREGIKELVELKEKTKKGNFDSNNRLQRDLEYMAYLKKREEGSYKDFSSVRFLHEDELSSILDNVDKMEAKAAAFEAAMVYWMIRERTDMGRKVMIVGNNRYGRLFVTEPLRSELELLNDLEMVDSIGSKYVKSHSGRDVKRGEQIFSDNHLRRIANSLPDIIVVDGTENLVADIHDELELPRFSSAMRGFYNWVNDFNEGKFGAKPRKPYGIMFRSSRNSDQIALDDHEDKAEILDSQSGSPENPQLIIINSTVDPDYFPEFPEDLRGHRVGYFDDPEDKIGGQKTLVFTANGLQEKEIKGKNLNDYVRAVQKAIEDSLLEMIMSKSSQSI